MTLGWTICRSSCPRSVRRPRMGTQLTICTGSPVLSPAKIFSTHNHTLLNRKKMTANFGNIRNKNKKEVYLCHPDSFVSMSCEVRLQETRLQFKILFIYPTDNASLDKWHNLCFNLRHTLSFRCWTMTIAKQRKPGISPYICVTDYKKRRISEYTLLSVSFRL